jgi:hypothetical protein
MDHRRRNIQTPRGRRDFRWEQRFCNRRPEFYAAEDRHVLFDEPTWTNAVPTDTETLVEAFLGAMSTYLDPPCLVFNTLRKFMKSENVGRLTIDQRLLPRGGLPLRESVLVDDRRDVNGGSELLRNWESEVYLNHPPSGDRPNIFTRVLNERTLYERLWNLVSITTGPSTRKLILLAKRK